MLNVVAIMGRLVANPTLRQTQGGKDVASFTVACDRNRKEAPADFIPVTAWDKTAQFVCRHFQKGSLIAIDGRLQSRQYQDKAGNNRTAIEIVANNVNFAGSKQDSGDTGKASKPSTDETALDGGDFAIVDDDSDLPF